MELKVDIIILGATGFTGKHAVKNLALLCKNIEYADIRWGIAGRSKEKLQNLLTELEELDVDIKRILVLECDVTMDNTVPTVTRQTEILINATGPNTLLSEPVVRACIQTGTHYVDISAELYALWYASAGNPFLSSNVCLLKSRTIATMIIRTMDVLLKVAHVPVIVHYDISAHMLNIYRTYNKAAQEANVLIIPACGFVCIPALGGLIYLEKQFEGTLHSVECYNVLDIPKKAYFPGCNKCLLHYGTWESMIHEMQTFRKYRELKKETFPDPERIPQELNRRFFHRHDGRSWCPYPGPDHDVVQMYQQYKSDIGDRPYHFKTYITMPLFIHFFIIVPVFFIYYFMCYFACLRNLLWKYPRFFTLGYVSHKGPNEEMRKGLKYSFTLIGKGWSKDADMKSSPDRSVTVKVSGNDPGYRTTGLALVLSAITLHKEKSIMPNGGVLTSGAAFNDTQLVKRLHENGITFETIENKSIADGNHVEKL